MSIKKAAAYLYVEISNECEITDTISAHKSTFEAGWDKAFQEIITILTIVEEKFDNDGYSSESGGVEYVLKIIRELESPPFDKMETKK